MKQNENEIKYFVYIRKSSDREDAQTLSIDAQKRELEKFAERNNFKIVDTLEESASAYKTGRPKFNDMLKRIENGEASGMLVYHLTRIARNSFDGGRVIYMMDEGKIKEIRTPEKAYYSTISDDKFMMHIHFAMAKKSSDDISQFVKRDIQSKILKGEYPVSAPVGYLNLDKYGRITGRRYDNEKQKMLEDIAKEEKDKLRRIEPDPCLSPLIAELFRLYGQGIYSVNQLCEKAFAMGLKGVRNDKMFAKSVIKGILSNPFYYGAIKWKGKIYEPETLPKENRHKAITNKKLFEKVQEILGNKSRPRKQVHNHKYTGIIRCGECGSMITAEIHKGVVYYRCTKKRRAGEPKCSQSYLKEDNKDGLEAQIQKTIKKYVIPEDFVKWSLEVLNSNNEKESNVRKGILTQQRKQFANIEQQLAQLLKMKISAKNINSELISDEDYIIEKNKLLDEKGIIKEKIENEEKTADNWLEQCEQFFDFAVSCEKKWLAGGSDENKIIFSLMFGSNATLYNKKLLVQAEKPLRKAVCFDNLCDWRGRRDSNARPSA